MAGHAGRSPSFRFADAWLGLAGALRSGGTGRHAPGRGPVGRTGWRNARGRPCLSAAAKAPRVLAGRLGLELPPPRAVPDPAAAPAVPDADVPGTAVARRREDPGPVPPGPVGGAAGRRLWEAMVERRHPLGRARPPGARVRQWIRPERHGVPGGTGFGSAAWRLAARDAWTGWTPGARAASTGRVVRSHRFLPLPGVRAYGLAPEVLRMAAARVADGREARYPGPSRGVLHPRRPGALRIPPSPRGLDRRRARRRAQGRGRHGARPGAGEGWRGAPRQAGRRPAGALAGACDGADIDRAERGYGRSAHDLRADPPAGRRHGPGLAGEHGRGAAGRPAGGGGGNGRVPAAAGPGGDHGARSGAALRGDRRPLPPRARRPGHAGHHDPEPHRPPGDGGAGRSRRRRKARLRRPRPRRAGGHGPGPPAGPVRHGRGPARRPGGGQPPPGGRAGPRPGAGGRPRGHAGGLRPRPRGRLPGAARQGGGRGDAPPARPGRSARRRVRDAGRRGDVPAGARRGPARHRGAGAGDPGLRRPGGPKGAHRPPGDPGGGGHGDAARGWGKARGAAALAAAHGRASGAGGGRRRPRRHRAGPVPQEVDRGDVVRNPRSGTRLEDRRPGAADGLGKRPASGAVTARPMSPTSPCPRGSARRPRRPMSVPSGTSGSRAPCWPSRATAGSSAWPPPERRRTSAPSSSAPGAPSGPTRPAGSRRAG